MAAPTTAVATANEFIKLAQAEGRLIDQMKLQKLLFYAHAWHLGITGEPLFDERVEAWPWGPVVRKVYVETSEYGRRPITDMLTDFKKVGEGFLDYQIVTPDGIDDPDASSLVRDVWNSYKHYTGVQLSNATHAEGEPWTIIREKVGHLDQKPEIPNDLIMSIFKKKLEDANHTDTAAR